MFSFLNLNHLNMLCNSHFIRKIYPILFVLLSSNLFAQNRINNLKFSISFAHYLNMEEREFEVPLPGYYDYTINPGGEVIYNWNFKEGFYLGSGINIQSGRNGSFVSSPYRFKFTEFSIPLLFSLGMNPQNLSKKSGLILTLGFYGGTYTNITSYSIGKGGDWQEYEHKYIDGYYKDNFFVDLYSDIGYYRKLSNKSVLSVHPFIKYKINTTWLNYHQNKMHFGFKVNCFFNLAGAVL